MAALTLFRVVVLHTNRDFFDYTSEHCTPSIGARVWVPFKQGKRVGIVLSIEAASDSPFQLKSIISVIDETPLISGSMLAEARWLSAYYQSPLSEVFSLILPKKYRLGQPCRLPTTDFYALNQAIDKKTLRSKRQQQLFDYLANQSTALSKQALLAAGFSTVLLNQALNKNVLIKQTAIKQPHPTSESITHPLKLNDEQAAALAVISQGLTAYQCFVLQGVTGSGKTEVYLQVIAKILALGKQVLILVPEIGLTPQLLARFSSRFQAPMVVIHSNLNDTERQQAWQLAYDNHVQLVIGTRSAIFTPLPKLGLIVIDEEHDTSLKQMEGVRYSARDTALMKAYMADIPIILGSATPSLETLHNCTLKKHTVLRLTQKAMKSTPLEYIVVDIRNKPLQHGIAEPTRLLIESHLQQQNQVLVFINRRGFSPVFLCHDCGWIAGCDSCDSYLTYHRTAHQLICHHCGKTKSVLTHCKACQCHNMLPVGVGTQRVYDYLSSLYPDTSILRIDRDEVQKRDQLDKYLQKIHAGEAQLIVGTQMLAKGHHFPRLTLVVVLDADNGFYNQDFRSLERLGQLLIQVSGRAGRAEFPGQVAIQTHFPQHPMLNLLIHEGYDAFATSLLTSRQEASLPPFHFLAMLRVQGPQLNRLLAFMHQTKAYLASFNVTTLGPAPAPLARKAGHHRLQLMIKSHARKQLSHALQQMRAWIATQKSYSGLRWTIDVDPTDLS